MKTRDWDTSMGGNEIAVTVIGRRDEGHPRVNTFISELNNVKCAKPEAAVVRFKQEVKC